MNSVEKLSDLGLGTELNAGKIDQSRKEDISKPGPVIAGETIEVNQEEFFAEFRENLEQINNFLPVSSTNLVFEFDELGEPPVVKVIDKESEEIIREIPPKEFREVAKVFDELADKLSNPRGIIFNDLV